MMPKFEETCAVYLSPDAVSSLKAPTLPIKPCRTTSSLVGKVHMAASQAGTCLHTIGIMQVYQADLLRDLDEVEEVGSDAIKELRWATDLSFLATKETARTINRSMASMVAMERHLWLNLSGIKEIFAP